MAWKGKVVAKSANYETGEIVINVDYFDDANPATVLHQEQFRFPAYYTTTEMQLAVRNKGAEARRKRSQTDSTSALIIVGTEVTI